MKLRLPLTTACLCATLAVHTTAFGQFGDQPTPTQGGAQPPAQQQAAPEQPAATQNVVAMVNGDPITVTEYSSALEPQLKQVNPADPNAAQQVRQQVMNGLIESRLVEQHLISNGPEVTDEEVSGVIDRYKQQVESQGVPFSQFMESRGYTEQGLSKRIQGSIAWQKFQQEQLTEENLKKHLEENQAQFQTDQLEQVQQQVAQSYLTTLYHQIVEETKPNAKIEVIQPTQPSAAQQGELPPGVPQ